MAITADTPLVEIIHKHRQTEAVFKDYEKQTGHCICCEALFEPLADVAAKYGLDLDELLIKLRDAAGNG